MGNARWPTGTGLNCLTLRSAVPDAPAPVDDVVAALVGMNSEGLPYQITAAPGGPNGVRVEVQWKQEELRWQTLFVRGSQAYAWRMEVDLDPATSHYKFVEHSGRATVRAAAGPTGATTYGRWAWQKGKTSGGTSAIVPRSRRRAGHGDRSGRAADLLGGRRHDQAG